MISVLYVAVVSSSRLVWSSEKKLVIEGCILKYSHDTSQPFEFVALYSFFRIIQEKLSGICEI